MATPAEWSRAEFNIVAADLSAVADSAYAFFSAEASNRLNRSLFTATTVKLAGCYLTAHLIAISSLKGPQGPVKSAAVGSVSVTYAVPTFGASIYSLTRYGLAFQQCARAAAVGGRVV